MTNIDLRPRIGDTRQKHDARLLLVCFFDPNGISTVWENINLLQKHSKYNFIVLNLWPGRSGHLCIPDSVDLETFDGVFIHPTACYSPQNLYNLDSAIKTKFAEFGGIKIIAKQDEHYMTSRFDDFISENGFDVLLTCVPDSELQKAYPRSLSSGILTISTLTGYVSDYMQNYASTPFAMRSVDLCYRGSLQPVSFGKLGFEKWFIGTSVDRHSATRNLKKDISSKWEDRISGDAWYTFLSNARATLGVESGSNIFDFDGKVKTACEAYAHKHGRDRVYTEEFYAEIHRDILAAHEGNVQYAQISPRHFEAAATSTLQIMYEGEYSGIFQPHRHYFPLKRDLSNLEEAVDLLLDPVRATRVTEAAREEIILPTTYTYRAFVEKFDEAISDRIDTARRLATPRSRSEAGRARVLNLCAHDPIVDPRIDWHSKSLLKDRFVCELGSYRFNVVGDKLSVEKVDNNYFRVRVERTLHNNVWKETPLADRDTRSAFLIAMRILEDCTNASPAALQRMVGAYDADATDIARFRSLCRYMLNTNSALLEGALYFGPFDTIICADLESLPAAIGLKEQWGCNVIFDSHEFWPFSYTDFRHWENDFWSRMEALLTREADVCLTVSDTLATTLSAEYGREFFVLPNATRLDEAPDQAAVETARIARASSKTVDFLFQGNFAPGRGIEHMIAAWPDASAGARLILRGPHNEVRKQMMNFAKELGLLNKTVFFPEAVKEGELIDRAMEAHVGLIPYDPDHYANRFACPNKLSQYMAAGLPILTTTIEYVAEIVSRNALGRVVQFSDKKRFIEEVNLLVSNLEQRNTYSRNARAYFETAFNWEAFSPKIYEAIPLRSRWNTNDALLEAKAASRGRADSFKKTTQRSQQRPAAKDTSFAASEQNNDLTLSASQERELAKMTEVALPTRRNPFSPLAAYLANHSVARVVLRPVWKILPTSARQAITKKFL